MKTVHKYSIEVLDSEFYRMPKGIEFLSVQVQKGQLCLWGLVDTKQPLMDTKIVIHGTGHDCSDVDGLIFVGTFQMFDGAFVGHVWANQ